MIERTVVIGLRPEFVAEAAALAAQIEAMATALPVVESVRATVGRADGPGPHIVVTLRFKDEDALATYLPHPAHRALVEGVLRPRAASMTATNAVLDPPGGPC